MIRTYFPTIVATTDKNGLYSIYGLIAGRFCVGESIRRGSVTYTTTFAIGGDTRLDIELPTYRLFGVVFERTPMGTAPIEGAELYCDGCGSPLGHTFAYTNAAGFYSFSYTYAGRNPIFVQKTGYDDPAGQAQGGAHHRRPTVIGDTRFDIELIRR